MLALPGESPATRIGHDGWRLSPDTLNEAWTMPQEEGRSNSDFWAFWSSLPGILTGVAAVIAAVATLAALFIGGDGADSPAPGTPVAAEPNSEPRSVDQAPASGPEVEGCFGTYFKGIPGDRVGTVEAGSTAYDVITESQPKAGTIGMTFTNNARPIGAIRFAFFPENRIFKIESIVDAGCRAIEDYESRTGGDKHVWQDSSAVRLHLNGRFYDLTANGAGSLIRIAFVPVVP